MNEYLGILIFALLFFIARNFQRRNKQESEKGRRSTTVSGINNKSKQSKNSRTTMSEENSERTHDSGRE